MISKSLHRRQQTDDELNVVTRRCAKVQAKSDEAHRKAEEERATIKRDLDNVRQDLAKITCVDPFVRSFVLTSRADVVT